MAKLEFELPPKEIMSKLLDNIEAQLPREDHVKYDSRAKKLDWEKIRVDGYNPEQCKKLWYYVQDRYEVCLKQYESELCNFTKYLVTTKILNVDKFVNANLLLFSKTFVKLHNSGMMFFTYLHKYNKIGIQRIASSITDREYLLDGYYIILFCFFSSSITEFEDFVSWPS